MPVSGKGISEWREINHTNEKYAGGDLQGHLHHPAIPVTARSCPHVHGRQPAPSFVCSVSVKAASLSSISAALMAVAEYIKNNLVVHGGTGIQRRALVCFGCIFGEVPGFTTSQSIIRDVPPENLHKTEPRPFRTGYTEARYALSPLYRIMLPEVLARPAASAIPDAPENGASTGPVMRQISVLWWAIQPLAPYITRAVSCPVSAISLTMRRKGS